MESFPFQLARETFGERPVPAWLHVIPGKLDILVHSLPTREQIDVPLTEHNGRRGGIHNSMTRIMLKPSHIIGGYAQLAYGFNYYGTVGSNRDEFVVVRKMKNINWLDGEGNDQVQESVK